MSTQFDAFKRKVEHCLCAPGDGVFTVNTAKERKAALRNKLYGQSENVDVLWRDSLTQLLESSHKAVMLGISSDCGGGILRGANWGPLFLRSALIDQQTQCRSFDLGDVRVIPHLLHDKYLNDATISNCQKALYGDKNDDYYVSPLSITEDVCDSFYATFKDKGIFGIGGDHSISYPLTKAYLKAKREQGKRTAIIHFDAHTDLLVERLGIDLCFGSWCTHILEFLPASIIATMSSVVTMSSRSAGTLNKRSTKLVKPLKNITNGVSAKVTHRIIVTTRTATASGMIIAKRFGIKSANNINSEVMVKNENKKLIFSRCTP